MMKTGESRMMSRWWADDEDSRMMWKDVRRCEQGFQWDRDAANAADDDGKEDDDAAG